MIIVRWTSTFTNTHTLYCKNRIVKVCQSDYVMQNTSANKLLSHETVNWLMIEIRSMLFCSQPFQLFFLLRRWVESWKPQSHQRFLCRQSCSAGIREEEETTAVLFVVSIRKALDEMGLGEERRAQIRCYWFILWIQCFGVTIWKLLSRLSSTITEPLLPQPVSRDVEWWWWGFS